MWQENTTWDSVEDVEKLWKHLGMDCLMVFIIIIMVYVQVDNVIREHDMGWWEDIEKLWKHLGRTAWLLSSSSTSSSWCILIMWQGTSIWGSVKDIEKLQKHLRSIILFIVIIIIVVYVYNVTEEHNTWQCRRHWEAMETSWGGLHDGHHHHHYHHDPHHGVCWQCDSRIRHGTEQKTLRSYGNSLRWTAW